MSEDNKLPIWAIVLIAIVGVLLLIGICYLIKKACCSGPINQNQNQKGDVSCSQRSRDICCAICICGWCLASVAEAGKTDVITYYQ